MADFQVDPNAAPLEFVVTPQDGPADDHVCKPGATVYYCPTSGETESDCHVGFDQCCDRPDEHRPVSTVLRDHLAAALLARIRQAVAPKPILPGSPTGSLFAATEFDLADTALSAFTEYLDIGEAEAWCKTCRRVWGGPGHRCESDAERRLARVRDLATRLEEFAENALKTDDRDLYAALAHDLRARASTDEPGTAATQATEPTVKDGA